jgi:hypothetical protein
MKVQENPNGVKLLPPVNLENLTPLLLNLRVSIENSLQIRTIDVNRGRLSLRNGESNENYI